MAGKAHGGKGLNACLGWVIPAPLLRGKAIALEAKVARFRFNGAKQKPPAKGERLVVSNAVDQRRMARAMAMMIQAPMNPATR